MGEKEKNKKDYMPILPFNDEENNHTLIYDNSEYFANRDRIANQVQMSSGNMIKYYSAKIEEEPVLIRPGQKAVPLLSEEEELERFDEEREEEIRAALPGPSEYEEANEEYSADENIDDTEGYDE